MKKRAAEKKAKAKAAAIAKKRAEKAAKAKKDALAAKKKALAKARD